MYSVFGPCGEEVITSLFQGGVSGALPDWDTMNIFRTVPLVQWLERETVNFDVSGSIPLRGAKIL